MLSVATIVVMLVVAYAYAREGLFTAALMVVNVLAAGLICYNFWEPVAGMLDSMVEGGALDGFQDFLSIVVIFGVTLLLLKLATNYVVDTQLEFHPMLHQFGGAAVGLLVGYLVSGFLISAMETLPWHRNFTGFVVRATGEPPMRSVFPPDRVWLGLMRHAGAFGFARDDDNPNADSAYDRCPTFDRAGTFELRYSRFRRSGDTSRDNPLPYRGEFDYELTHPVHVPAPPTPATPAKSAAPQATPPGKQPASPPTENPAATAKVPPPEQKDKQKAAEAEEKKPPMSK